MYSSKSFGFIGGFVFGGIFGAAIALLLAPASGQETRSQIRSEGEALKQRGQDYGDEKVQEAQTIVKKGQKGVSDVQARLNGAIQDQKDNLQEAIGSGKQAASQRRDEMVEHIKN